MGAGPLRSVQRGMLMFAVCTGAGCVAYRAAPLKPEESQAAFMSRTLLDPRVIVAARAPAAAAPATQTATQPAAQVWDLDSLARAAVLLHPDLAAARAHVVATQAAEVTAGEMPNPSISVAPQFSSNPGDVNPWTVGFTFDIPIETAGKRARRIEQARALTEAARLDVADTAWRVRSRVRDALAEYLLDMEQARLWEREVDTRDRYVRLITARLQAGEAARPEVDTARVDLLTARQSRRAAEGLVADARTKLAAAIGVPTAGLAGTEMVWPGLDSFPPLDTATQSFQTAGLVNRIAVRRALAEYAAADAGLRLELARQYPDLHLGPGYTFDQGQNKWELGLSVTLPILNQNGGAVAEAIGRRAELAQKFVGLQAQVVAEMESAAARYEAALVELHDAQEQVDFLHEQWQAGERAVRAGEGDRLTSTGLEVQYTVTARLRLDAVRKAQAARGAVEDAIERPWDGGEKAPPANATPGAIQHKDEAP